MNRLLVLSIFLLLFSASAHSQPDTLWTRTIDYNRLPPAKIMEFTADDGCIIVSSGWRIFRLDSQGGIVWDRYLFEGSNGEPQDIIRLTEDRYAMVGYVRADNSNSYIGCMMEIDQEGEIQWIQYYSGLGSLTLNSITLTADEGYVAVGNTCVLDYRLDSNVFLVRTNNAGDSLWTARIREDSAVFAYSAIELENRNIIVSARNKIWLPGDVVGHPILYCLDSNGGSIWTRMLGDAYVYYPSKLLPAEDNNFYFATQTAGPIWLIKFNSVGDSLWRREYSGHSTRVLYDVQQTSDGGFIFTGDNGQGRGFILKADVNGNQIWQRNYLNPDRITLVMFRSISEAGDRGFLAIGNIRYDYNDPHHGIFLLRTLPDPTLGTDQNAVSFPEEFSLSAFPNPFNPNTTISFSLSQAEQLKLSVYDILGREVKTLLNERLQAGTHEVKFEGNNLPSGIYLAKLQTATYQKEQKLLLLK